MREPSKIMTKAESRAKDLDKEIATAKKAVDKAQTALANTQEKLTKLLVRKNKLSAVVPA